MKADILRLLFAAHYEGDDAAFRKAALQLAAAESAAGHIRVAEDLRAIVAKMPAKTQRQTSTIVDIAQPRGDLADILEGSRRDERLRDIILSDDLQQQLIRVIAENRSKGKLERWGVSPRRRLLFHGPPGCGKTLAAAVLAGEMGLPLMTVRFDALFSRFLGATASQLRAVFDEMPRRPGVYLFDEFDAVAKARGDAQDVGEMHRVVTAFLQLVDADVSGSIMVAATNHHDLLDRAVFRRFDMIIPFEKPNPQDIADLIRLRLEGVGLPLHMLMSLASQARDLSFADVARICDDAIRTMALDGREAVIIPDVEEAIAVAQRRLIPQ